jgi:hypothetical protein
MALFEWIDRVLSRGGQVVLDVGTLMPGGYLVNGGQAVYHGAHAVHDLSRRQVGEALAQAGECAWNAINSMPGIHHALHAAHVAETIWDVMATAYRWMGGRVPNAVEGLSGLFPTLVGLSHQGTIDVGLTPEHHGEPVPVAAAG